MDWTLPTTYILYYSYYGLTQFTLRTLNTRITNVHSHVTRSHEINSNLVFSSISFSLSLRSASLFLSLAGLLLSSPEPAGYPPVRLSRRRVHAECQFRHLCPFRAKPSLSTRITMEPTARGASRWKDWNGWNGWPAAVPPTVAKRSTYLGPGDKTSGV